MIELPLIIGHRGASAVTPENTLVAFERAMQDGADGVELDVRLARDRVPVVIHDTTLARTGLVSGLVSELSSGELLRTDVGSWFNRQQRDATDQFAGQKLPTLSQVLDLFEQYSGVLYLEMKSEGTGMSLAAETVRTIQQHSMGERVIVLSFDLSLVREVKNVDSGIRTAALFEPRASRPVALVRRMRLVELAKDCGADEIALHHSLAGRRLVEKTQQAGLSTVVWTVDNARWVERARSLGIKALITNNPAPMLRFRSRSSAFEALKDNRVQCP